MLHTSLADRYNILCVRFLSDVVGLIIKGNPAHSSLTQTMLDRQQEIYGHYPPKAALDSSFASKDKLQQAKTRLQG
jgi:hypothetical protein